MRFIQLTTLSAAVFATAAFSACSDDAPPIFPGGGSGGAGTGGVVPGSGGAATGGSVSMGGGDGDMASGGMMNMGGHMAGVGGPCASDKHCSDADAVCDQDTNACVECSEDDDCGDAEECMAGECVGFTSCDSSKDCGADEVCDNDAGRCVECVGDNDCDDELTCNNNVCSASCDSDKDCTPDGKVCDTDAGVCVECVRDQDCDSGESCTDQGLCSSGICGEDQGACDGDTLYVCREDGSGYEVIECRDGCDADSLTCGSGGGAGCNPKVRVLIQRSGSMFEHPGGDDNWWDAVTDALAGSGSNLLKEFGSDIDLSVSTFHMTGQDNCPMVETESPSSSGDLRDFFADEEDAHNDDVGDGAKVDAPLPDAIAEAASDLGDSGDRYLLLVISGNPDSCDSQDSVCAIEPSIEEVQAAYDDGIKTKVLYLESTGHQDGYPEGLANAGAGEGVEQINADCGDSDVEYSDSPGDVEPEMPEGADDVKDALASLLAATAACE